MSDNERTSETVFPDTPRTLIRRIPELAANKTKRRIEKTIAAVEADFDAR